VLELVATETSSVVRNHFSKTVSYRKTFAATDAWVIHFTCQDHYLDHPVWQTEEQLEEGVNVIHLWHDRRFSTVLMSARWKDDEGKTHQADGHPIISSSFMVARLVWPLYFNYLSFILTTCNNAPYWIFIRLL
jgi:hypothetical protein